MRKLEITRVQVKNEGSCQFCEVRGPDKWVIQVTSEKQAAPSVRFCDACWMQVRTAEEAKSAFQADAGHVWCKLIAQPVCENCGYSDDIETTETRCPAAPTQPDNYLEKEIEAWRKKVGKREAQLKEFGLENIRLRKALEQYVRYSCAGCGGYIGGVAKEALATRQGVADE